MFSQMIAYHDPELYNHLDSNMFYPDVRNACSEEVTYLHSISIAAICYSMVLDYVHTYVTVICVSV